MEVIFLCPPLAHCGYDMSFHHNIPGYKCATLLVLRVGGRDLVNYHNSVLQFPVHKMQPEFGATGCPTWTALNQTVDRCGHPQECHPILLWSKESQWLWLCPGPTLLAVLHLELDGHVCRGQLWSPLLTHKPLHLIHTVRVSLTGYMSPIDCGVLLPGNGPIMTKHFRHIFHVSSDTNFLKEDN